MSQLILIKYFVFLWQTCVVIDMNFVYASADLGPLYVYFIFSFFVTISCHKM